MIRIVLADDQEMVRMGLRLVLESEPDLEVVGEAADGIQAIELVRRLRPDVVLMDIRMPRLDGLEATRRLVAADDAVRIVVLTTFDEDEHLHGALKAGASGFLLKVSPPEQLVEAIRTVAAGNGLIDPAVTRRVISAFVSHREVEPSPATVSALSTLTPREREVLAAMATGRTNREIADGFVLSEATIKTHVARVLMKLGLRDRVQAVIFAYECGLIRPGGGHPTG